MEKLEDSGILGGRMAHWDHKRHCVPFCESHSSQTGPCSHLHQERSKDIIGFLTINYVATEKTCPSSALIRAGFPPWPILPQFYCIREISDQPHVTGDILSTSVHFRFFSGFILDSRSFEQRTGIEQDIQTCQQHGCLRGL